MILVHINFCNTLFTHILKIMKSLCTIWYYIYITYTAANIAFPQS